MRPPALTEKLAALSARAVRGMSLGLDRVLGALDQLGNPQRDLAVVHVAGSNGKGSSSAMIESIARAAGLRWIADPARALKQSADDVAGSPGGTCNPARVTVPTPSPA